MESGFWDVLGHLNLGLEICEALVSKPFGQSRRMGRHPQVLGMLEIMHWSHEKKKRNTYTILTRGISIYWIEITNFSEKRTFLNESHVLHKENTMLLGVLFLFCDINMTSKATSCCCVGNVQELNGSTELWFIYV